MPSLYRIRFCHYAPKDSEEGIKGYVVVEDEAAIADYVAKEYMLLDDEALNERLNKYGELDYYEEEEVDEEEFFETRLARLARHKGDMDDDRDLMADLYYGATLYKWEEITRDVTEAEVLLLEKLGILIDKQKAE